MVLTKETYVIHIGSLLLAFPALWILEQISPSARAPRTRQQWTGRDLTKALLVCGALIVFFYTGAFLDWPNFNREFGTIGSLAGLWETFFKWTATGTQGHTGHEKPWAYWLELLSRYEWPAAAGLATVPFILRKGTDRMLRYLAIAGTGTLTAYSIIAYKTPWCLIVMMWPFLLLFGVIVIRAMRSVDRWVTGCVCALLLGGSWLIAQRLNFRNYTDEQEPYVYVQTLPDINSLMGPLGELTRINPAFFHLRGYILLPENDCHPLSWLLAPYSRVQFLDQTIPPADMSADFLLVEDAIVSDVEERLQEAYFKEPFILRGSWGNSATLYLKVSTFAPVLPNRTPEFHPQVATPEETNATDDAPPELPVLGITAPPSTDP